MATDDSQTPRRSPRTPKPKQRRDAGEKEGETSAQAAGRQVARVRFDAEADTPRTARRKQRSARKNARRSQRTGPTPPSTPTVPAAPDGSDGETHAPEAAATDGPTAQAPVTQDLPANATANETAAAATPRLPAAPSDDLGPGRGTGPPLPADTAAGKTTGSKRDPVDVDTFWSPSDDEDSSSDDDSSASDEDFFESLRDKLRGKSKHDGVKHVFAKRQTAKPWKHVPTYPHAFAVQRGLHVPVDWRGEAVIFHLHHDPVWAPLYKESGPSGLGIEVAHLWPALSRLGDVISYIEESTDKASGLGLEAVKRVGRTLHGIADLLAGRVDDISTYAQAQAQPKNSFAAALQNTVHTHVLQSVHAAYSPPVSGLAATELLSSLRKRQLAAARKQIKSATISKEPPQPAPGRKGARP